jgi:hypothetical protein
MDQNPLQALGKSLLRHVNLLGAFWILGGFIH